MDPTNIGSLFDVVINADLLTNHLLLEGILFGLNLAIMSRYSNRKHGLALVGLITMFLAAALIMLYKMDMTRLFVWGLLQTITGAFIAIKENVLDFN